MNTFFSLGQSEEDIIIGIKKEYSDIKQWVEKESTLPDIEIYEQCDEDEEGNEDISTATIRYFYKGGQLRCIEHYSEPNTSEYISTQYYLSNNKILFSYQLIEYKSNLYKSDEIINEIETLETLVYYNNEKPIKCLNKTFNTNSKKELKWSSEKNLLEILEKTPIRIENCESSIEKFNDVSYYLKLLILNDFQLRDKCMSRKGNQRD